MNLLDLEKKDWSDQCLDVSYPGIVIMFDIVRRADVFSTVASNFPAMLAREPIANRRG